MTGGDVAHVDQVEAGVDIRGEPAGQEVDDDLSRRRRLDVAVADGRRGTDHHHRQAARRTRRRPRVRRAACCACSRQSRRRAWRRRARRPACRPRAPPASRPSWYGRCAARRAPRPPRARRACPRRWCGRSRPDRARTGGSRRRNERPRRSPRSPGGPSGVGHVAGDALHRQRRQQRGVARRPHQAAHAPPAPDQRARHLGADEAGRARHEGGHDAASTCRVVMVDRGPPGRQEILGQDLAPGRGVGQRPGVGLSSHRRQPCRIAEQLLQRGRPRLRRRRLRDQPRLALRRGTARCRCPPRRSAAAPSSSLRAPRSTAPRSPPAGRTDRPTRRRAPAWSDPARPGQVARSPSSVITASRSGPFPAHRRCRSAPRSFSRADRLRQHQHVLDRIEAAHRDHQLAVGRDAQRRVSHRRSRCPGSNTSRWIPRRSNPTRAGPSSAASRARSSAREASTNAQRR